MSLFIDRLILTDNLLGNTLIVRVQFMRTKVACNSRVEESFHKLFCTLRSLLFAYGLVPSLLSGEYHKVCRGQWCSCRGQWWIQSSVHVSFPSFLFGPITLASLKWYNVSFEEVSYPQLVELVEKYEPDLIWTDGDWEKTDVQWKSKEFLAWLYNKRLQQK